ncbi:MAG TPA: hydroxyacylglutathione hydrolase [Sorangium sp.]|nr:hydroxyacylglutathione hydrolase [Sorangium sp.]
MTLSITPIACLRDNYAYVLTIDDHRCIVIDPSEADPVREHIRRHNLRLSAIINTHHHFDHVGGNDALCAEQQRAGGPPLEVIAHESDRGRVPGQTTFITDNAQVHVAGMNFLALHVPGHTLGAVAYLIDNAVFTGDTLFLAGCGRMFEGTAAQMHGSLMKLAALPPTTQVYCGHEYTVANLRFAQQAEPGNTRIRARLSRAQARVARGDMTIPASMADEVATNPFLRCAVPALSARYGGGTPSQVFAAMRAAKDAF